MTPNTSMELDPEKREKWIPARISRSFFSGAPGVYPSGGLTERVLAGPWLSWSLLSQGYFRARSLRNGYISMKSIDRNFNMHDYPVINSPSVGRQYATVYPRHGFRAAVWYWNQRIIIRRILFYHEKYVSIRYTTSPIVRGRKMWLIAVSATAITYVIGRMYSNNKYRV